MKYVVDKIIDDVVILENLETGELLEEDIKKLPIEIHEGSVVVYRDNKYILNLTLEEKRREDLRNRLNRLKTNSNGD